LKLWADAICINQRDLPERNRQVKRMGDIFGGALIVTIWLGNVPDEALDGMALLHECIVQCNDDKSATTAVDALLEDPTRQDVARAAIDLLANAPYWSRVWVIQEKCLGPFNPQILFGRFRFNLISLHHFFAYATNVRRAVHAREKVWRILKLVELVLSIQERRLQKKPANEKELEEQHQSDADGLGLLLMLSRLAGAVDLRDKLYGLMGMIPDYVADHIEPDYAKPIDQVFCDFARALITGFESFNFVLTGIADTDLKIPSWAPDLTDPWDPYLWGTNCRASRDRKPTFRIEHDGLELIASGFQVDSVDGMAPYLGWQHSSLDVWKPAVQPTSTAMPEDAKTAIVRTLHRDATWDCTTGTTVLDIPWIDTFDPSNPRIQTLKARGWDPVLRHANLSDLTQLYRRLDENFKPWGREFRSFFCDEDDSVPVCSDLGSFIKSLDKHAGVVYPIITTAAGRFGTAIRPVQTGDRIFIILGCDAPVILRPKGEGDEAFEVVSQCYVEGLMLGEGIDLLESGKAVLKDVRLH